MKYLAAFARGLVARLERLAIALGRCLSVVVVYAILVAGAKVILRPSNSLEAFAIGTLLFVLLGLIAGVVKWMVAVARDEVDEQPSAPMPALVSSTNKVISMDLYRRAANDE